MSTARGKPAGNAVRIWRTASGPPMPARIRTAPWWSSLEAPAPTSASEEIFFSSASRFCLNCAATGASSTRCVVSAGASFRSSSDRFLKLGGAARCAAACDAAVLRSRCRSPCSAGLPSARTRARGELDRHVDGSECFGRCVADVAQQGVEVLRVFAEGWRGGFERRRVAGEVEVVDVVGEAEGAVFRRTSPCPASTVARAGASTSAASKFGSSKENVSSCLQQRAFRRRRPSPASRRFLRLHASQHQASRRPHRSPASRIRPLRSTRPRPARFADRRLARHLRDDVVGFGHEGRDVGVDVAIFRLLRAARTRQRIGVGLVARRQHVVVAMQLRGQVARPARRSQPSRRAASVGFFVDHFDRTDRPARGSNFSIASSMAASSATSTITAARRCRAPTDRAWSDRLPAPRRAPASDSAERRRSQAAPGRASSAARREDSAHCRGATLRSMPSSSYTLRISSGSWYGLPR